MPKYPSPRFVEHKIAESFILGYPAGLFPQRAPGRCRHPPHYHIADFAFGMATDGMNNFDRVHRMKISIIIYFLILQVMAIL
jgi:hypothetical protein